MELPATRTLRLEYSRRRARGAPGAVPRRRGVRSPRDAPGTRERFGCQTYAEFAELLAARTEELITVATPAISTPSRRFRRYGTASTLSSRSHFPGSVADADRMIDAAREAGRLLTCNQNGRYGADFVKLREVIASGVLGRIVEIRIALHQFSRRWDWQTLRIQRRPTQ